MPQKILFEIGLDEVSDKDTEGVGVLRYAEDGKIYRWIKNRNATAFTAKQPVCYDAGNVATVALIRSVNSPVTADLMLQAGIVMTGIGKSGGTTGCYGWVQVQGYCQDALVATPNTTAGGITAAIALGSNLAVIDGKTALAHESVVTTAPVYSNIFTALEALAAATPSVATAKDVYIKCL